MDYAHRHGIIHRDIKPANMMLLDDGGVKVMDFGVARLEHSTLTALGTVVGSVRYMAPEQMMGERVDGRADVFSVAAVAYELLTGRAPFPGKTITEVVSRVVHGAHVPPQNADDRLPAALNGVFARAFAPRPADRYPRALDFARDLQAAAQPALDLQVAPGPEAAADSRTEVVASTATPTPTLPAPRPHPRPPRRTWRKRSFSTAEAAGDDCSWKFSQRTPSPRWTARASRCPGEGTRGDAGRIHSLRLRRDGHYEVSCVFEVNAAQPVLLLTAVLPPRPSLELTLAFPPPRPGRSAAGRTRAPGPIRVVRGAAPSARGVCARRCLPAGRVARSCGWKRSRASLR